MDRNRVVLGAGAPFPRRAGERFGAAATALIGRGSALLVDPRRLRRTAFRLATTATGAALLATGIRRRYARLRTPAAPRGTRSAPP